MQSCVDHESSSCSDLIVDCCTPQYKVMLSNFLKKNIIIIIFSHFGFIIIDQSNGTLVILNNCKIDSPCASN